MIYNIKVNENKTIEVDDITINYSENEIDSFSFTFFDENLSYIAELKTPLKKKISLPINDNILLITNSITSLPGKWELLVVGKDGDKVFVSNSIEFVVNNNYLDYKEAQEIDANIEQLYLELEEKLQTLESLDLENLDSMNTDIQTIKSTTNNIISISSQILEVVNYNKTTLNSINTKVESNLNATASLHQKIGDNDTKADGTLYNYSYWGLVRAEEAKVNTQAIIELLTDANTLTNEILEKLE